MSERWFLAIWPDEGARRALMDQLAGFGRLPGRPTHPLDWHLTLVFIGELPDQALACVEAAAAFPYAPIAISLDRIGYFPGSRVLWCGPASTPEPLARLVSGLQTRLKSCGIEPDPRPYRPHLTLARQVRAAPDWRLSRSIGWVASELVLAYGVSGAVPRYRIHRRYPLVPAEG